MQPQKPQSAQAAPNPGTPSRKVLVDETTVELARRLGISVEEYLERVVHFFLHPPQEPILSVVEAPDSQSPGHREPVDSRPTAPFQEARSAPQRKVG